MTALAALSVAIWVYLLAAHGRFWQAGPVLPSDRPTEPLPVTAVVPARNEAPLIARTVGSLLAQNYAGPFRVILVDDGSTDDTGRIARSQADPHLSPAADAVMTGEGSPRVMAGEGLPGLDPGTSTSSRGKDVDGRDKPGHDGQGRLVILTGAPRPPGWTGKLWALAQGIAEATDTLGDGFILLTDADIEHDPNHVATLVAKAERDGLDLVSEMVALSCVSVAEQALIPAFVFFFQLLYPFEWVNDPLRGTAAAAGGTILIRRRALERIGGIASIRGALIDDMALAGAVKRGGRIWLGHSALARSIRPYPSMADIWRMIARSAYVQLRFSPLLLVLCLIGLGLTFIMPPLAAIHGHGAARILGFLAWAALGWSYLPTLRRFGLSPIWSLFLPAMALFYMAATLGSAVNHHLGRGIAWKGRAYQDAAS